MDDFRIQSQINILVAQRNAATDAVVQLGADAEVLRKQIVDLTVENAKLRAELAQHADAPGPTPAE